MSRPARTDSDGALIEHHAAAVELPQRFVKPWQRGGQLRMQRIRRIDHEHSAAGQPETQQGAASEAVDQQDGQHRENEVEGLAKRNTGNRILHKAKRNQPLSDPQKQQNRQWSSIRSTVERVFGVLKQHYGIGKARYLGLQRNQARFMLAAMAYNITRGVAVQAGMMAIAG